MINVSDSPNEPGLKQEQSDALEFVAAWEAFVGSFTSGEPDLAERSEEILRADSAVIFVTDHSDHVTLRT
jgi:hypothetical protein